MKRSASALIAAASLLIAAGSMAATRPHYGGTLRIAVQAAPTSLDPADSSQPDSFTRRNLSRLILDTLVDQDDRGRLLPAIATSWEPEPGNQRWHFYLRPGISFHNGTAVNSDNVAASLRTANPNWKVFATGDSVVIECDSPDPWLPAELSLPRNGIAKREGGKLVGSGPFAISHWDPGKKLELSARDDYWRGRAFVDSIEIEMGRNFREQVIDLDLGKADVVEAAPEQAHRAVMEGRTVQSSASFELMALVFSRDPQTPDEARQRQVLGLSIDRAAINNVLLQGSAEPTGALLPGWMTGYAFLFPSDSLRALLEPGLRCERSVGSCHCGENHVECPRCWVVRATYERRGGRFPAGQNPARVVGCGLGINQTCREFETAATETHERCLLRSVRGRDFPTRIQTHHSTLTFENHDSSGFNREELDHRPRRELAHTGCVARNGEAMSFRRKLLAVFGLTVFVSVAAVTWIVSISTRRTFERANEERTAALVAQFHHEFNRRGEEVAQRVEAIARSDNATRIALAINRSAPDYGAYLNEANLSE